MKIRETDPPRDDELMEEIKSQRSTKSIWVQAVVAGLLAVASALGGYQVTQISTDPQARPDPFTGTEGKLMQERIDRNTTYNKERWDQVARHMDAQFASISALTDAISKLLARCSEVQARDEAMQRQIDINAKRLDRTEETVLGHFRAEGH